MTCCQCQAIERMFDRKEAESQLRDYQEHGPARTTRQLVEAIRAEGVAGETLLDIGGGIGAIQLELLEAGAASATDVDASSGYLSVAGEEAERRGYGERVTYQYGNFVDLAPDIAPAGIVTLDRVLCCYPDAPALLAASTARARRLYGLVYPRDTWWIRLGGRVMNFGLWLWRSQFRFYVHRAATVEALLRGAGLEPHFQHAGFFWQVLLYRRVRENASGQAAPGGAAFTERS